MSTFYLAMATGGAMCSASSKGSRRFGYWVTLSGATARSLANLLVLTSFCSIAWTAALVPAPAPLQPPVPAVGLEANRGQAKASILFLVPEISSSIPGGSVSIAVTSQSILYSPLGASLNLVAGNPTPTVSFSNSLPGLVNYYTGGDPQKWATGVPRYGTADLAGIYPGINAPDERRDPRPRHALAGRNVEAVFGGVACAHEAATT